MRIPALALSLLLLAVPVLAQAPPAATEDGPYVLWEGQQAKVLRIRQGKAETTPLAADRKLRIDGLPPLTLSPGLSQPEACIQPLPVRIAAVSDTHGNFAGLATLLEKHGIMNASHRWTFDQGHLVVVGDTFDRGGGVTECLWLLRSLQAQAPGRVHVLLGNHEAMVLKGDVRYLNPKYQALPGLLALDIPALYGPDSEQGRWLRSLNILLRLGDILFVHGGPSPALAAQGLELPDLNAQGREALGLSTASPVLGNIGPLWYRGLIPGASALDATDEQVTAILKAFHASFLVVGHSTQDRVTAFHQGRVFGIDAGLQTGKDGELWLWENGKAARGRMDGTRVPLP